MQIDFKPNKIKAAKAYIENLVEDYNHTEKKKRENQVSFFKKIFNILFK